MQASDCGFDAKRDDDFGRALRARLEIAMRSGEEIVEGYRHDVAKSLLGAGLTAIPSDHLRDHQIVVSRGIYDAVKSEIKALNPTAPNQ